MWQNNAGQQGESPRMVWTDMDRWHWTGLRLPPSAVRSATHSHVAALAEPVSAAAQFGPEGLTIDLVPGQFGELSDMLVATRVGAAAPMVTSPGTLTIGSDDVLRPGVFISGAMDDLRSRRQKVYEDLLVQSWSNPDQSGFPHRAMLLGWSRGPHHGFMVPQEGMISRDASVVAIPLSIQQPQPGTRVLVPSPLLPFKEVRSVGGSPLVGVYMHDTNSWRGEMRHGTTMVMRFELPRELLPLTIERAELTAALRAPGRSVELLNPHDPAAAPLEVWRSAGGMVSATVRDSVAFHPNDEGHIYVMIRVTDAEAASRQDWGLFGLWLEVEGVHDPAR
jgi:hypothetical protein